MINPFRTLTPKQIEQAHQRLASQCQVIAERRSIGNLNHEDPCVDESNMLPKDQRRSTPTQAANDEAKQPAQPKAVVRQYKPRKVG
jgi:hypothetical protein